MDYHPQKENSGEGMAHPAAANKLSTQPWSPVTVADPLTKGFDNLQDAQQAGQAGAACGQYPNGGAVPNVAPAALVQPAAGEVQQ